MGQEDLKIDQLIMVFIVIINIMIIWEVHIKKSNRHCLFLGWGGWGMGGLNSKPDNVKARQDDFCHFFLYKHNSIQRLSAICFGLVLFHREENSL